MGSGETSLEELRQMAEQGDSGAMMGVAMRLKNGIGCNQDLPEAVKYLTQAAEGGNADAALELGLCYAYGMGVNQDDKVSTYWLRKGAEMGSPEAMYRLFQNLSIGVGCGINLAEADMWLRKASDSGHNKAEEVMQHLMATGRLGKDLENPDSSLRGGIPGRDKPASYVHVEAVSPSNRFSLFSESEDGNKKDEIISQDYTPPVEKRTVGIMILVYLLAGGLSGFLLMSVFRQELSVMGSYSLLQFFSSEESLTAYMVFEGAVIGLIVGFGLSRVMGKIKENLILYLPLLLMPFIVMGMSPIIMSLLQGAKTLLTGVFTVIVYLIVGFSLFGSTSNR